MFIIHCPPIFCSYTLPNSIFYSLPLNIAQPSLTIALLFAKRCPPLAVKRCQRQQNKKGLLSDNKCRQLTNYYTDAAGGKGPIG
jgi:hypothetical protein